ncbi:hypothetical protein F511_40103 [Dorcoceras hygrometricum]|uniref:Uncharacterized protein n=1 Tax=Dorcoceras hygrometricum TaxID=472368 RepID=A0A2Z7D985_9LAMI|nr:hypothetical protein F511_40103 [Dorcoceras hygrometricum]
MRLYKERRVQDGHFLDRRDMILGRRSQIGGWLGLERVVRSWVPEQVGLKYANEGWTLYAELCHRRLDFICRTVPTKVGLYMPNCATEGWTLYAERVGLVNVRRRATREGASAELGLSAELVGLMHSRRRATRGGASAELGFERHIPEQGNIIESRADQCKTPMQDEIIKPDEKFQSWAAVDRQSGPCPDSIFLQSACTRKLMDLPRTESPRCGDRNKSGHEAGDGRRRHTAAEGGGA